MDREDAKKLVYKPVNVWLDRGVKENAHEYCRGYRAFIDSAKTEREAVYYAVADAEKHGFVPFERGKTYKPGDRIYYVNRGKGIYLAVIGRQKTETGVRMIIAHTDCPRLDLKQKPLYEDGNLALMKTHYYGGIKKYQWTAQPLSLHGVVYRADGSRVDIRIGEDEDEPVLYITDLMPHIAKDQVAKTLAEGITGEELNLVAGSEPFDAEEGAKLKVLALLNEKYGITEADLITAELSAVPASRSREVGFDRSMICAYGHDDRICAYPAYTALFEAGVPEHTCIAAFADKEEIGSEGVTGLKSDFLKHFLTDLCASDGSDYILCCASSICLSSDVGGAFDPTFASAYDTHNSARVGNGPVVVKYTGARGKSGCSDASAEVVSRITRIFDAAGVIWQCGEYGKVDQGGAGTVAAEVAMLNIDVIDVGVPILSMHSTGELASKGDIYMMYLADRAFYASK